MESFHDQQATKSPSVLCLPFPKYISFFFVSACFGAVDLDVFFIKVGDFVIVLSVNLTQSEKSEFALAFFFWALIAIGSIIYLDY